MYAYDVVIHSTYVYHTLQVYGYAVCIQQVLRMHIQIHSLHAEDIMTHDTW